MNILIVGLVKNAQLKRVQEEGQKLGHQVDGCYASELVIYSSGSEFSPTLRGKSLNGYDLIYLWTVGKRRREWNVAAEFLNSNHKTIIVNKVVIDPSVNYSPTPALSYLQQFKNKLPFPVSASVFNSKSVNSVIHKFKPPYIIKTSTGHKGQGIFKTDSVKKLKEIIRENAKVAPAFVIREYIPNNGDLRVFCVGYKAIGAMKRIPPEGDFRSNISVGGTGEAYDLEKNPKVRDLAEKVAEATKIEIAGVDIILDKNTGEPYILEVNPGPQFTGLEEYTGVNAAGEIVKYFERVYNMRHGNH